MDYALMEAQDLELRSLISIVAQPDGTLVPVDQDPERCDQLRASIAEHEAYFAEQYAAFCAQHQRGS